MAQESEKQLKPGTVLSHGDFDFTIVKVLGEGSFGITYLAKMTNRKAPGAPIEVAVKEFFMHDINGRQNSMVTSSVCDGMYDKYMRKFKGEASALNRLHHQNIVRVHSCFEANNTVYYAMEFLTGGSVDDYLAQNGPMDQGNAMRIAAQMASALSYLHSSNMLHLDLKPSNLMLRQDGNVALIDFGLAKQFDDSGQPESSTTIGGGTPGYAPIEQQNSMDLNNFYNGRSTMLPVTMDIYAFGATLYKMLVGKLPPMPDEILDYDMLPPQHLYERQVRAEIISLITKAMRPRKKDRYQSIQEMYRDIEPLLPAEQRVKIWTPEDLKRQQSEPEEPQPAPAYVPPTPPAPAYQEDGATVIAGANGKPAPQAQSQSQSQSHSQSQSQSQGQSQSQTPWANDQGTTISTFGSQNNKKKKEKPQPSSDAGNGGKSKLGLIIAICAVLLIGAAAAAFFLMKASDGEAAEAEDEVVLVAEEEAAEEAVAEQPAQAPAQKPQEAAQPQAPAQPAEQPAAQPATPAQSTPEPAPVPAAPVLKSVLGGKADYDASSRTITFKAPYSLRVGDNVISVPAGAVMTKVKIRPDGKLGACVLSFDGYNERLDGLNVAL